MDLQGSHGGDEEGLDGNHFDVLLELLQSKKDILKDE